MAKPRKPPANLLKLAEQAKPKARAQRTAKERRAIRLTRSWRQWQETHGGGGGGGGQPFDPTAPYTMQQINQLAAQMAQGDILPQQQAIQREQDQLLQTAQQQGQLITGLTTGLGGIVGNIAPSIQTAYRQAAQDQAGFAQGFSQGMEQIAQAEAARNTADLEKWGAPAAQIADVQGQGQGAGDVLYGVGGYLPASSLGQQGAAFAAYGAQLPGIVGRMGQQDAADLAATTRQDAKALADRAADLAAQLPGLRQQYVQTLLGNEMDKMAMRKAMAELGLSQQQVENQNTQFYAGLDADAANAAAAAEAETVANRAEATKAKSAYLEDIGHGIVSIWGDLNQGGGGSQPTGVLIPGGGISIIPGSGGDGKKPTYRQAFNAIYGALKAQYGNANGKWKFAIKDAAIRKKIREFLRRQGLTPPKGNEPVVTYWSPDSGGDAGPAAGAVFPGLVTPGAPGFRGG